MIDLTKQQIDCALLRVEDGLKKYLSSQDSLKNVDVSKDQDFQKRFNHFYHIRRNRNWQSQFYKLLQEKKKKGFAFADALRIINKNTGRLEASFASKLVATINPEKPVIDKFVLDNADLKLPYSSANDRQAKILSVYNLLQKRIEDFLITKNGTYLVKKFREKYPKEKITNMKMADLVLWQAR